MPAGRTRWIAVGAGVVAGVVIAVMVLRGGSPPLAPVPAGELPTPVERPDARGAPSAATPGAQAAQLVAAAATEATAGRYAEAHALLDRAYALDPQPPTLFQLAVVELQLGRCRDARRTAQRVLAASPGSGLGEQARRLLARIGRCD